ncbi:MAG: 7-cyano-7-deazaguanine synthase [Chloroflexota bacterium]
MNEIAVLTSGGLDSAILLADLAKSNKTRPIYVRSGLRWENEEISSLQSFIETINNPLISEIVTLSIDGSSLYGKKHWSLCGEVPAYDEPDENVYIPGRNLILVGLAAIWCSSHNISSIFLGSLKGNPFTDATDNFIKDYSEILKIGLNKDISVQAPYRGKNKIELIKEFKHLPLDKTMTCMQPVGMIHCNACNKCKERRDAFEKAGIEDKTKYNNEEN